LDDQTFGGLLDAFSRIEPTLSPDQFSLELRKIAPSMPGEQIDDYVHLLCALYPSKDFRGKTAAALASDVKETFLDENISELSPDALAVLESRITRLFSIDGAIETTAKAISIMTDHPKVFHDSRVTSDIRPVYEQATELVSAAVVVHTLTIGYREVGHPHREFSVAMDDNDLKILKTAIERAEKKSDVLKNLVQQSGVKFLKIG
jgi:hypothetical protein